MTLEESVANALRRAEQQVREHCRIDLPEAEIDFSLRGRCAGQACLIEGRRTQVRINRQLLAENFDDYLKVTIPHEVAHLAVNWIARLQRKRPRPHGPEWQAVMRDCFGLEPIRCHEYVTTPARIVPRNHLYRCNCRDHHLTSIMHRKIVRSRGASCRHCHQPLSFLKRLKP